MKLSRLKQLRPDVWEEAKRQTIKQKGEEKWDYYVRIDVDISMAFTWINSDQEHKPWQNIYYHDDFTLYDEWLASQTKQPESKKEIDYWRYKFTGMAMQGFASNHAFCKDVPDGQIDDYFEIVVKSSLEVADKLIKELQKEKP